jgi:hypothetical protein
MHEFSGLKSGHRVDYAQTPEYLYADARGQETSMLGLQLAGAAVIKPIPGGVQVISITPGQTVRLNLKTLSFPVPKAEQLRVRWEDWTGARHEEALLPITQMQLELKFPDWAMLAVIGQ